METKDLDYFLTASRLLNYTQAAKVHYLSPQTFVNHIRALEKELDAELLVSTKNGLELTEAGKTLQKHLPGVKATLDDMAEDVHAAAEGYGGCLNVTSLDGLVFPDCYISAMCALQTRNPQVEIRANRSNYKGVRRAIDSSYCDAIVTMDFEVEDRDDLERIVLAHTSAAVAIPLQHPLAGKQHIVSADLDGVDLYVPGDLSVTYDPPLQGILSRGVKPLIHTMRNSSTSVMIAEMGLGISWHFFDTILAGNPSLCLKPVEDNGAYDIVFCWKRGCANPALDLFVRYLREEMA